MKKTLSKTAKKILDLGFGVVLPNQPRLMKAMKELDAMGVAHIKEQTNDYGHKWFIVTIKQ